LKILLIDNHDSFTFNLVHLLRSFNNIEVDVIAVDALQLEDVKPYSKILFSPGPGLPSDRPLLREIILRYAPEKPMLGVCLGHQAIAEAFGATLMRIDPVCHGLVVQVKILQASCLLFRGLKSGFDAGLYHSWAVSEENFPAELEVTAVSEKGVIMALQHRTYEIYGVQFHPESIMTPEGRILMENWLVI